MSCELSGNVLDLAGFRLKKQINLSSSFPSTPSSSPKISQNELENNIDNIKQSIQRINKLMEELKSISEKPNK